MTVQLLGYLASVLVFAAFYMRTMVPLRWVAIASNFAFIAYGVPLHLWPVVGLHIVLLPLNVMRLVQIRAMLHRIDAARRGQLDVQGLIAALRPARHPAGTVLFAKGDRGDSAYVIASGEVALPERGIRLRKGDMFGEIALLSPDGARTASAVCETAVELYRIDGGAIVTAFHQNPAFAMALVRLATGRLVEDLSRLDGKPAPAVA